MMKMGTEFWAAHVAAIQRELIPASEYVLWTPQSRQ